MQMLTESVADQALEVKEEYARGEDRPLGSRLALIVIYKALVGSFLLPRGRYGKGFPERIAAGDLALAGVATGALAGFATAPRATRLVSSIFAVVAISDFLQIFYKGSEESLP